MLRSTKKLKITALALAILAVTGCTSNAQQADNGGYSGALAVEDSGLKCVVPQLPDYAALPMIDALPDPFLSLNGKRIKRKKDWTCRRAEISAQVQRYELGEKPAKPDHVSGVAEGEDIVVTVTEGDKTISFTAKIVLPSVGQAPYPAIIAIGRSSLNNDALSKLGVAVINFPNGDVGEQLNGGSRGKGKFFELYGKDHSASAMMAWSWGVSRLIDALETTPNTKINARRLGVTGCSRNGKGALIVGAFDERIALTIPQESGSGGSASWRVSDAQKASGQNVQTLSQITNENVWLTDSFRKFRYTATKLPIDHHEVMGLVAPRALLVIENTSMEWLGNISTQTTAVVAHNIWEAMGVGDNMGASQIGDHNHCQYPDSQLPELTAYVEKFLKDNNTTDTRIMKTDGDFTLDIERWVPWDVPALR